MKCLPLCITVLLASALAIADDGLLQIRDVSKTPDFETHHATIKQLPLYVPAQAQPGELITILYEPVVDDSGDFVVERNYARPLVALYEDGPVEHPEDSGGFYGHGERDFYAAVSLDDGATWKRANLSDSADRSSISISVPLNKKKTKKVPYPGDVFRNFVTSAENKVLAVWASRYCDSGTPNYSMEISAIETIFASEHVDLSQLGDADACTDGDAGETDPSLCLYFEDYWHVAGSQQVKDFAEEDYPSVGEVPYACLWTARGTLELNDEGLFEMVWRKAERLTSGVRDVHRMEAAAVPGAGWVVTWQEDPEGLRPGKGEGPGEGWSGAIAHHETDIWYSFIDWDNFDLVKDDDGTIMPLAAFDSDTAPKVGVPMSMPVRVTDNAKCAKPAEGEPPDDPYCQIDFDNNETPDFCASDVQYDIVTPEGPIQTVSMCVAEDGRLMRGNTGSARARTNLRGYDSDNDGTNDSAWVVFAYEEHKGLGEEDDEEGDKIDMGKNIWYHTFDMFKPELVSQGMMLNQPAIYPRDVELGTLVGYTLTPVDATAYTDYEAGGDFMIIDPDPVYSIVGLESTLYQTEIARRYSQITQPASKAGESGLVALAMYKQGIVRQGGPADVFARRFVIPEGFDPAVDNPFDYANMECADRLFTDGTNPRYVKGLCLSTPQNLSGTIPVNCDEGVDACAANLFPYDDLVADIDKADAPGGLPKMIEWRMCQEEGQTFAVHSAGGDVTQFNCPDSNLNDQSWENPWDLAKGHRGFMKGDFIMQMYAWSPNWEAQVEGHDNYNLYVRRSFDGGVTWTTLPSAGIMEVPEGVEIVADGTFTCEWYGIPGATSEYSVCFDYAAGEFEQARNLSQLIGSTDTVLDPRFAPTAPTILGCLVESADADLIVEIENPCASYEELPYPDDFTDPSKYFATFEIGDASEIALGGEPVPMDMRYARAVNYGDDIEMADTNADGIANIDPNETEDFEVFDKLEWHDPHAAEAALASNPGGTLFYAIWNEWMEDGDYVYDSDAMVRRTMELGDLYVTTPTGGDGSGGGGGGTDPGCNGKSNKPDCD